MAGLLEFSEFSNGFLEHVVVALDDFLRRFEVAHRLDQPDYSRRGIDVGIFEIALPHAGFAVGRGYLGVAWAVQPGVDLDHALDAGELDRPDLPDLPARLGHPAGFVDRRRRRGQDELSSLEGMALLRHQAAALVEAEIALPGISRPAWSGNFEVAVAGNGEIQGIPGQLHPAVLEVRNLTDARQHDRERRCGRAPVPAEAAIV